MDLPAGVYLKEGNGRGKNYPVNFVHQLRDKMVVCACRYQVFEMYDTQTGLVKARWMGQRIHNSDCVVHKGADNG